MLATISDRKFGVSSGGSSLISYYNPHIVTAQDYYPFGMLSRADVSGSSKSYRFGFNGKMNDNDVKGGLGNQQDYGMRIYDGRVGRFLSVDPLQTKYPGLTPYQFSSNGPIANIDLDGLEKYYYALAFSKQGAPTLNLIRSENYSELHPTGGTYYTLDGAPVSELEDVINPGKRYFVQFSYDTYAVTEALAVPYKATVEVEFSSDPTKMKIDNVLQGVDDKVESTENWNQFRQGFAGGLGAGRPRVPRLSSTKSTMGGNTESKIKQKASASHNGINESLSAEKGVFSKGGSISTKNNELLLTISEGKYKRISGEWNINGKKLYLEGTVSVENGVLKIKGVGIRNKAGDYNNTDLVNNIGPSQFRNLLQQLTELRKKEGFMKGEMEFERMKPKDSKLKDRESTTISF